MILLSQFIIYWQQQVFSVISTIETHKMAFCSTIKQAKYADYKTSSEKDTFETLNLVFTKTKQY